MSSSIQLGLLQLLGSSDLDEFFENTWEREPRLFPEVIKGVSTQILTVDEFEILASGVGSGPATGLSIVEGHMARPVIGGQTLLSTVYEAYHRRCTLLQSGLQLRLPPTAGICRDVENQMISHGLPLAEAVGANAYLTPADSQGFDTHYDNHCALILQLDGSKNWTVFPPLDDMPVARCERPIRREDLQSPILVAKLMAGDVLYLPRGFPHCASTAGDPSLHVTLSLRPVTWAEAIHALCESDPAFRRSVTPSGRASSDAYMHFTREWVPRFASMDVERFLRRRLSESLSKLFPLPLGGLRAIEAGRDLDAHTPVVRTSGMICLVGVENGEVALRFPGASLRLPAEMKPVFEFVAGHEEFTPAMLPSVESAYDRVELVQILIKRGLLQPQRKCPSAGPSETS